MYQKAFEKFQEAKDLKPDYHEAFNNSGIVLGGLAKTKSGEAAETLYQQAFEQFQKALDIKPDQHATFYIWGAYLGDLAKTKSDVESETLYQQAFEKFQKSLEIKPDNLEALNNWGTYIGNLAKTKSGDAAESLYQQAFEKYQKAFELGGSSYNLACGYALKSDKANALLYLKNSLENKEIKVDFVKNDEDWKNYLDDEDFKEIISCYHYCPVKQIATPTA